MSKSRSISVHPQDSLFKVNSTDIPLSARMRPQALSEVVGQKHILSNDSILVRAVHADRLTSIIFYGPPGTGKTSLAHCISQQTQRSFEKVNAVSANVEDLRRVIAGAQNRLATTGKKTILFIDEIHRFNKAQQDVLMPDLEEGNLTLIGATVLNPFFTLIGPLLSRSMILELKPLTEEDILTVLLRAIADKDKGLGELSVIAQQEALDFIAKASDGDARKALNALEIGCLTTPANAAGKVVFDLDVAQQSIQKKRVNYDRDGDEHYDTASAFIKSMRGSDPDATLYWLAKMIYAGEDIRFIARRICICASEDVSNADPQALILANAALNVCEFIGLPEARIVLAQAAVYVACAPKSNASYLGIDKALEDVKNKKTQEVPLHLKDASYQGAKSLGRGADYKYAHNYEDHYVDQEYMPLKEKYYDPQGVGHEKEIIERLSKLKSRSSSKG